MRSKVNAVISNFSWSEVVFGRSTSSVGSAWCRPPGLLGKCWEVVGEIELEPFCWGVEVCRGLVSSGKSAETRSPMIN